MTTLYMPLFRSCKTFKTLTQLHAHLIITTNLHKNQLASTKLIESYAQLGSLESSKLVYNTYPNPDSFMSGVLIKSYVWNNLFQEAISLYTSLLKNRLSISSFIFPSILRACSGFGDGVIGKNVHGRIIKSGFDLDAVVQTSLLFMYGEMGCLYDAQSVFDEMGVRDIVSWSSIIYSYIRNGLDNEGLGLFRTMLIENVEPDSVIMLCVAEACGALGFPVSAKSVHGYVLRHAMEIDGSVGNSLISMYSKCNDLYSSEKLFDSVSKRNISSWTAMISSYNYNGCFLEALAVFSEMIEAKEAPNEVTMLSVLSCCASLSLVNEGKSVHCFVVKKAIDPGFSFLGPALLKFYADCEEMSNCKKIFGMIKGKSIVPWNKLISIFAQKGLSDQAIVEFSQMHKHGLLPDSYTLASTLSACADIGLSQLGHQIHGHCIKTGISNEFVTNSLIDMYSKCGFVYMAYDIFDRVEHKGVMTWNSMICGFAQNGNSEEAIHLFNCMYLNSLEMDQITFLSVIQACSNIGYLKRGKWVHHKLIIYGIEKDRYIDTALTDMYAKCGDLKMAQIVFENISERSVVSWSAMIAGYGMHGKVEAAISLFNEMVNTGTNPNEISFMNILSACGHAGSVEKGKLYFNMMKEFGIEPNTEHFACMIDLLSRAGDLDGAYNILKSMPFLPDASLWGALINGCRIHQRMDMIKTIEINLLDIYTDDPGYYTVLSNTYAEGGNWHEFRKVRSKIQKIGLRKVPGYSSIEIGKEIYRFGAGDALVSDTKEVDQVLENLQMLANEQMYDVGNVSYMVDSSEFYEKLQKTGNCILNNQLRIDTTCFNEFVSL